MSDPRASGRDWCGVPRQRSRRALGSSSGRPLRHRAGQTPSSRASRRTLQVQTTPAFPTLWQSRKPSRLIFGKSGPDLESRTGWIRPGSKVQGWTQPEAPGPAASAGPISNVARLPQGLLSAGINNLEAHPERLGAIRLQAGECRKRSSTGAEIVTVFAGHDLNPAGQSA